MKERAVDGSNVQVKSQPASQMKKIDYYKIIIVILFAVSDIVLCCNSYVCYDEPQRD